MNTFKKILAWGLPLFLFLAFFSVVNAQTDTSVGISNPLKWKNLNMALVGAMGIIVKVGGIVAVVYFIWSGWKFIDAKGDPAKIKAAREQLFWTVVGTLVLLGADVIARLITNTISSVKA